MKGPLLVRLGSGDRDLWWVAALLWSACAVRVAVALVRGETFGADATAAAAWLAAVPWLLLERRGPSKGL